MRGFEQRYRECVEESFKHVNEDVVPIARGINPQVESMVSDDHSIRVYHAPIGYLAMTTSGFFGYDLPSSEFFPLSDMFLCIKVADDCVDEIGVQNHREFLDKFKGAILGCDVGGDGCLTDAVLKSTREILLPHQASYSKIEERLDNLKATVFADLESKAYPDFHQASIDGGRQAGGLVHSVSANITGNDDELMKRYLEELGIVVNLLDNVKNYGDDTERFHCRHSSDYMRLVYDLGVYTLNAVNMLPISMRRDAVRSFSPGLRRCLRGISDFISR